MTKKRGLGRSLDALLVGSSTTEEVSSLKSKERLCQIPIEVISRGKYQPRREMDADALEELASSIRVQGIIQPIVLRPLIGGRYEIVAGERRWRAAQLAGLTEVPAVVKEIPDEAAIAIALIENIQRENLNPIEEAVAFQRLLNEFTMTHQQVAEAVGKSRATVTNTLRLLALPEIIKAKLERRELEMGHARALLTLPEALQLQAADIILAKNLSVREAESLVRTMQSHASTEKSKPPADPDIRRLQQYFSEHLALKVKIFRNTKGKGKVVIHYDDLNELDTILSHFEVAEEE